MGEVKGYKAFNNDLTNRYGKLFVEGETYRVDGEIKFGNNGNGFHMCTALSDVFRYVDATKEDVLAAEVTGRGKCIKYDDVYYGYYDMYSCEQITIDRFLLRKEIIEMMLNSVSYEVIKFLITFKLNENEKILFARRFRKDIGVMKTLLYYQFDCTEVYRSEFEFERECARLVLENGKNNS